MTRRESVIEALEHREIQPIPYSIGLTSLASQAVIDAGKEKELKEGFGSYITSSYYAGWPTEIPEKPGYYLDDFGVVWNRSGADKDIGVIEGYVINNPEQCDYTFPRPDTQRFRQEIEYVLAHRGDRFTIAGFGFTMFERAWSLMGMENLLLYMFDYPEALESIFDRICDYFLELVDIALEYNIDAIIFGDDWGQQHRLIMGPKHWRRFIKPRMARLYQRVKSKGKYVCQHSCGDCREILGDLTEIGLDCYQTFQPEIYPLEETKKTVGDKLTFWGGVSTQQCLPCMSPAGVQEEIVKLMKIVGKNGGLIMGPTHAVPYDVPVENILAMIEVFQNQEAFL